MISFAIQWILWPMLLLALLFLPAGIGVAIAFRKKRRWMIGGLVLIILSILSYIILSPVILWQFDAHRGWELRIPIKISGYEICLVQEPGFDFYNSYFEITRGDGKSAIVLIDGDDGRWWNPDTVQQDGKTYFVRGLGLINNRTSHIDPSNDIIYSGYYQRIHKISELSFKELHNKQRELTVKPPSE